MNTTTDRAAGALRVALGPRVAVYGMFFLSGAVALVLETLWTRQFVTVFGASSYAVATVLCAFMAGLGIGGLLFGRVADRVRIINMRKDVSLGKETREGFDDLFAASHADQPIVNKRDLHSSQQ